jgi:hypothetical protein
MLPPVDLSDLTETQLLRLLATPPSNLLVDCGGRLMPHQLGVCCFVEQLLQMHQHGACLWLCNVHPGLRRCLHQLKLGPLLHLNR